MVVIKIKLMLMKPGMKPDRTNISGSSERSNSIYKGIHAQHIRKKSGKKREKKIVDHYARIIKENKADNSG
jgi:hypothetical protein